MFSQHNTPGGKVLRHTIKCFRKGDLRNIVSELSEDQRVYVEGEIQQNFVETAEMGRQYRTDMVINDIKIF